VDTIAVVIARGGSRRLPRKNVRSFCGHPLVAWSIVAAACSRLVDYVYLSTDDDEIAEIGKTYGVDGVIRRPDWPDADAVAANRVYRHAIEVLEPMHGMDYTCVQLLPTSPLRKPHDIDMAVAFSREIGGQAHLVGAAPCRETNIYEKLLDGVCQSYTIDKSYRFLAGASGLVNICSPRWYLWFTEKLGTDQDADLDRMLHENRHPDRVFYYSACEPWQAWETDTEVEFEMCEIAMERMILRGEGIGIYEKYRSA